jgi:hypothetical protein
MELDMNCLVPMQKLNPEFKIAQPLPALLAISPARNRSVGAPKALRREELPKRLVSLKTESFATMRNLTA